MIKRIIAIFLVALTFAFSVPIGAYAVETESEFAWKDLDATPIQEDLKGVDLTKYIKNTSIINPSIIAVAEQGFSEQTDYNNCALYVYVYNPTGKAVKPQGLNKLQVKHENTDVKIYLSYVDSTDTIIKFRVDLSKSFFEKLNTKMRIYEISSLELQYEDNTIEDYEIGGTYIFTGFDENTKLEKVETFEVISLDVKFTTYRIPYDIRDDGEYMHQLTSVYFSVPDYYEQRYGNVYGMVCSYEKYYTKPFVVVNNQDLYLQLRGAKTTVLPLVDVENSKMGKDYYSSSVFNGLSNKTVDILDMTNVDICYHWWYNISAFLKTDEFESNYGAKILPFLIYKDADFDSDFWISSEEVTDEVHAFYKSPLGVRAEYKNSKIGDYYHSLLFENYVFDVDGSQDFFAYRNSSNGVSYNTAFHSEEITFDSEKFNIYSYSSSHNGWDKLNDIGIKSLWKKLKNDVTYEGLSRVERVSSTVAGFDNDVICSNYLINENEVADFKTELLSAKQNNSSVFLFRLDVAPCVISNLTTEKPIDNKFSGYAISLQEPVYMGFDVVDLMFKDENGEIVYIPVSSDPKDLIGGVEAPPSDSTVDKDWFEEFKGTISKFLKLFALCAIVLLGVVFLPHIVKLVSSFIEMISSLVSGTGNSTDYSNKRPKRKRGKRK